MDHNWNLVYEDGDMKVSQMLVLLNYWLRLELILCLALSHTETLIWRVCNMWFFYWQRYTGEIMKKEVLYWILWRLPISCRYVEDDVSNVPNFFLVVSITSHWISFYRFHTKSWKVVDFYNMIIQARKVVRLECQLWNVLGNSRK